MLDRCSCLVTVVCAQTMLAAYNAGHNHYFVLDGGNLSCDPSRPDMYGSHNYYYVQSGGTLDTTCLHPAFETPCPSGSGGHGYYLHSHAFTAQMRAEHRVAALGPILYNNATGLEEVKAFMCQFERVTSTSYHGLLGPIIGGGRSTTFRSAQSLGCCRSRLASTRGQRYYAQVPRGESRLLRCACGAGSQWS